jgi:hypothetical protein
MKYEEIHPRSPEEISAMIETGNHREIMDAILSAIYYEDVHFAANCLLKGLRSTKGRSRAWVASLVDTYMCVQHTSLHVVEMIEELRKRDESDATFDAAYDQHIEEAMEQIEIFARQKGLN